jgi:hypothetical protein
MRPMPAIMPIAIPAFAPAEMPSLLEPDADELDVDVGVAVAAALAMVGLDDDETALELVDCVCDTCRLSVAATGMEFVFAAPLRVFVGLGISSVNVVKPPMTPLNVGDAVT